MTPSQQAKLMGLKNLKQVSEITGASGPTLHNWAKNKPALFKTVLAGCVAEKVLMYKGFEIKHSPKHFTTQEFDWDYMSHGAIVGSVSSLQHCINRINGLT
jgi:hypothetical protein